jgi:hypothetical protein
VLRRLSNTFFVACLVLAARIPAQQSDTSAVPRELAIAFARVYAAADSTAAVEFLPATVAPSVASDVAIPPESRVVGSVVFGRNTYVFGISPLPADSVRAWYSREYLRRKWPALSLVRTQAPGGAAGGFRPPPPKVPTTFCNGDRELDVAATESPAGRTNFRVRVASAALPCSMVPRGAVRPLAPSLPLPVVYNPPNTQPGPQCFTSGASTQRTQTQLMTSLDAQALLQHYGKQLEASGWVPLQAQSGIATQGWSRRDSTGTSEIATLSVSSSPTAPMCRTATLEVLTPRSRE